MRSSWKFGGVEEEFLGPVSVDELVSVENAPSAPLRSAPGFR